MIKKKKKSNVPKIILHNVYVHITPKFTTGAELNKSSKMIK
jgi:hypothetical protein